MRPPREKNEENKNATLGKQLEMGSKYLKDGEILLRLFPWRSPYFVVYGRVPGPSSLPMMHCALPAAICAAPLILVKDLSARTASRKS